MDSQPSLSRRGEPAAAVNYHHNRVTQSDLLIEARPTSGDRPPHVAGQPQHEISHPAVPSPKLPNANTSTRTYPSADAHTPFWQTPTWSAN